MTLTEKINSDIKAAMKAKDKVALGALRGIKKELIEAGTAEGASNEVSEEAGIKLMQKMVKQRKDAAAIYAAQGREDLVEAENAEIAVIAKYLPEQMTGAELEKEIGAIIQKAGASSIKEMGKVMGMAAKQLAGKADGKEMADMVKKLLNT
ncbi:hypothetical protein SAMN06265379_102388 [Saccharicrinis carchari]|uniref:Glutamyl-tRNA amidotransferase n=1 Tax=Saccharicrinis carchari TaxID=1168039 RepID=A0A521C4G1_SACCC|nr:GatB/YqeY domain-containing protein [Saccharicrinis carchari]SMO54283.1 hypothetical protein SAMN06265379_102388 [Saccharicrinis carchari]